MFLTPGIFVLTGKLDKKYGEIERRGSSNGNNKGKLLANSPQRHRHSSLFRSMAMSTGKQRKVPGSEGQDDGNVNTLISAFSIENSSVSDCINNKVLWGCFGIWININPQLHNHIFQFSMNSIKLKLPSSYQNTKAAKYQTEALIVCVLALAAQILQTC